MAITRVSGGSRSDAAPGVVLRCSALWPGGRCYTVGPTPERGGSREFRAAGDLGAQGDPGAAGPRECLWSDGRCYTVGPGTWGSRESRGSRGSKDSRTQRPKKPRGSKHRRGSGVTGMAGSTEVMEPRTGPMAEEIWGFRHQGVQGGRSPETQ